MYHWFNQRGETLKPVPMKWSRLKFRDKKVAKTKNKNFPSGHNVLPHRIDRFIQISSNNVFRHLYPRDMHSAIYQVDCHVWLASKWWELIYHAHRYSLTQQYINYRWQVALELDSWCIGRCIIAVSWMSLVWLGNTGCPTEKCPYFTIQLVYKHVQQLAISRR